MRVFWWLVGIGLMSCNSSVSPVDMQQVAHGQQLYERYCVNCHQPDGKGLAQIVPPLLNADYLVTHRNRLPGFIKFGTQEAMTVNGVYYQLKMPATPKLSDDELTALVNFVEFRYAKSTKLMPKDSVVRLLADTFKNEKQP